MDEYSNSKMGKEHKAVQKKYNTNHITNQLNTCSNEPYW